MQKRASGILLHITSLPSKYGIGDLGPQAYYFADFLAKAKQSYWQILPLNLPVLTYPYSPYNSLSAFAGNTLLISPQLLYQQGLLSKKDIQEKPAFPKMWVNYQSVISHKARLLNVAFERFKAIPREPHYELFCSKNKNWLDDFATFTALCQHLRSNSPSNWPAKIRDKDEHTLKSIRTELRESIDREKFSQYIFFRQWSSLKNYCNQRNIRIIGDVPIYVSFDSTDVWANPKIFKLTSTKKPQFLAGVPPDLFSQTGQLWGNPVYNWQALRNTNYSWWIERIRHNLTLFDIVRLDHFRAFVAYWQVPAGHKTAKKGKWIKGPGKNFFGELLKHFPSKKIIVEDLGHITKNVRALVEKFHLRGMRILQYAFDGNPITNPHCLQNHIKNCVVYTGTHDNNTARGWFEKEATPEQKKRLFDYLGHKVPVGQTHWELIRVAMNSTGNLVIIPMQDILGLSEQTRMNRPAVIKGNWIWRLKPGQIKAPTARKLAKLTQNYYRA